MIVATTAIARAIVLSSFDTSHGDAVVGTIWSAFLADLRLWGLIVGGLGIVAAAVFEPGAPGAWRRSAARVMAPHGSAARLARAGGLVVLAVLLLWMPEVPLDLALVTRRGPAGLQRRGRGRPIGPTVINPMRGCNRAPLRSITCI